jgi:hypothetical protein
MKKLLSVFFLLLFSLQIQAAVNCISFATAPSCGFRITYSLTAMPTGNKVSIQFISPSASGGGVYHSVVLYNQLNGGYDYVGGPSCGGAITAGVWQANIKVLNLAGTVIASCGSNLTITPGQVTNCAACPPSGIRVAANMGNTGNDVVTNGPGDPGQLAFVGITCNSFFPNTNICGSFWGGFTVSNPYGVSVTRKLTISGPSGVYSTHTSTGVFNGSYNSANWGLACGGNVPAGTWTMSVQLFYPNGTIAASCQKSYTIGIGYACAPCNNGGGNRMGNNDEETTSSLSISPNPATDHLNVQIPTDLGINKLKILNLNGQIVMEKDINSDTNELELNVNSLPNAMYILRLEGAGKPQITKFIKE